MSDRRDQDSVVDPEDRAGLGNERRGPPGNGGSSPGEPAGSCGLADGRRALIWDLDGTIADTRRDIATGVGEMLRELGRPPLEADRIIRNVGRGVHVLVAGCLADAGEPARNTAEIEHGVRVFRACYWRHLMDTTVAYPGMPELLHELAARGRAMAIVSNKPEDATREILRRMGLLDCFVTVLGGDSLPVRKPDPEPLWHALRVCLRGGSGDPATNSGRGAGGAVEPDPRGAHRGGASSRMHRASADNWAIGDVAMRELSSARAAMIGDSLPDVQAARAAGMPVAGVGWGFDPDGEMRRAAVDWWFESVAELKQAVCG